MKKAIVIILMASSFIMLSQPAHAQAWHRGAKAFSFGIGGTYYWHLSNDFYAGRWSRTLGLISVQGEFAVHDYVGVGFATGLAFGGSTFNYYSELAIPIGAVGNFHFWQLIDDKVGKDMHADKLDLYAGLSIGSGIAFFPEISESSAIFFVGPHFGARYYFTDSFGVMAEVGYGKSWVNAGIVLKSGR